MTSIVVKFARSGGVRIEAQGADVDALYRAHLAAYGANDEATKDCLRAVENRVFVTEASADEFLPLADALYRVGMREVARELYWHDAHERAEALREEAADIEDAAMRLESRYA